MRPIPLLMLLALLAGCEAEAPTPRDVAAGEAEGLAPAATGAIPPTPDAAILQPLTRTEFEARLESGAGCSLERDADLLVVTVMGDGVAKAGGRVADLGGVPTTLNAMSEGGRFTAGDLSIAVAPFGEGTLEEGVVGRPARVEVRSAGREERFTGRWVCGS